MDFVKLTDYDEPCSYTEVMKRDDHMKWEKAMKSKMDSLHKNGTWDLVPLPKGKKALPCKWVYKIKVVPRDDKPKYKARLLAKGFKQELGIDFNEIFLLVVKMTTLRMVLGLVPHEDMELSQMDVKIPFLHGDLHEDIYMEQPVGHVVKGKEHLVCKLKKILYGLKQAPREWYQKDDTFMRSQGYMRSETVCLVLHNICICHGEAFDMEWVREAEAKLACMGQPRDGQRCAITSMIELRAIRTIGSEEAMERAQGGNEGACDLGSSSKRRDNLARAMYREQARVNIHQVFGEQALADMDSSSSST
ncbi:hypothetical protein L7F22_010024 [Adiantum nelumboides]|nr:hypothetical protein [Adiantum nelumboides]